MNLEERLQSLGDQDAAQHWSFDEFENRHTQSLDRKRRIARGAVGSLAVSGLVVVSVMLSLPRPVDVVADVHNQVSAPALVDLGQFDVTSELEDHIAVLDAELSSARVGVTRVDQLQQMESARDRLNDSLQRVSYAHSLLSL
jgi:hypothetical protein